MAVKYVIRCEGIAALKNEDFQLELKNYPTQYHTSILAYA